MFEYMFIFPVAILVAALANSSGFSGGVIFQPIFYFFLQMPLPISIATGIATETLGMSSGALRYWRMKLVAFHHYRVLVPWIILGNLLGIFLFQTISLYHLRIVLGSVLVLISVLHMVMLLKDLSILQVSPWGKRGGLLAVFSGGSSALTGTGQAELMQPLLMFIQKLDVRKANATAIALEATGNILISLFNLKTGNIHYGILLWTGSGVIVGAQLGAYFSPKIPAVMMRALFSFLVFGIGVFYLYRSLAM